MIGCLDGIYLRPLYESMELVFCVADCYLEKLQKTKF
jgi:hypothetical protein